MIWIESREYREELQKIKVKYCSRKTRACEARNEYGNGKRAGNLFRNVPPAPSDKFKHRLCKGIRNRKKTDK